MNFLEYGRMGGKGRGGKDWVKPCNDGGGFAFLSFLADFVPCGG